MIWQPLRSANADASAVNALLAGDTHTALDDAHTAVSTDPVSATALWELSEIDLAIGDRAGAREDLVRATSRQPDNPETWQRLGEFDLRYGHPRRAVPELKKAVSLDLTAVQPLGPGRRVHEAAANAPRHVRRSWTRSTASPVTRTRGYGLGRAGPACTAPPTLALA